MKITVFGATGRVGENFTIRALSDGHHITALVRNEENVAAELKKHKNFKMVLGDAKDPAGVSSVISSDTEIVFSALSTDKSNTLSEAVPLIIEEMKSKNIKRFLSIGTAGILQARSHPSLFRFESDESKRKSTKAAKEHAAAFKLLRDSQLTWTIFCPTYLPDGPADKQVDFDLDFLPEKGTQITTGNTAWFSYTHMLNPLFFMQRVGLAESE